MRCRCSIVLEFPDEDTASKVLDSVKVENGEFVRAIREGKRLVCEADDETIGGILHTAEDFLSCVALAEKMIKK